MTSFRVHNLGLVEHLASAVRQIGHAIYSGPAPKHLHHYTDVNAVEAIINSRSLWATCIADQNDKSEIVNATELVAEISEAKIRTRISAFAKEVLQCLAAQMEERR